MRSVNLLRIAAEAELLRQQAMLARYLRRAAFGLAALVFAVGVLVTVEVAGWQALRLYLSAMAATLVLLGVNLVFAVVLSVPALRSQPTAQEKEALRIRRQALDGARAALTLTAVLPAVPRLLRLGRSQSQRDSGLLAHFRSKAPGGN
jgi:hypothetical protein